MTKPVTAQDVSNEIDRDIVWRIRELSALKLAAKNASTNDQDAFLRALITMMYAHWEGFVRNCAIRYFQHITMRKFYFEKLEEQFYINSFLTRLDGLFRSRESIQEKSSLISDIISRKEKRFSHIQPALIDTRSNLNSYVLKDICQICSFDYSGFEGNEDFLDIILLKRRNAVAHGQTIDLAATEMDNLVDRTTGLMRHFKTLVENKVYEASYLKS